MITTTKPQVVVNKMTKAQFEAATKVEGEFYIITDETVDASEVTGLANVATSGNYEDLSNKPTTPTNTSDLTNDGSDGTSVYVEANNLKTINSQSVTGSGNITLPTSTDVTNEINNAINNILPLIYAGL